MRLTLLARFAAVSSLLLACGGDDGEKLLTPDQCNPLGVPGATTTCIAPWPSAIYEVEDTTTATGVRLEYPEDALPVNIDGVKISPSLYAGHDGFSSAAPIMVTFPTGMDGANLPKFTDIGASITDASPTVIIDMETGELVEHFAELDARSADTPADQALFIRSAKELAGGHHYAVAIKKTLKAPGGVDLPIPEGFQAILDGKKTKHPLLEKIRPHYVDIFAKLEAKGIHQTDLVVAWDFHTRSRDQVHADLLNARVTTLAAIGTNAANVTYTVTDMMSPTGDARIARKIVGKYKAPLFLTNGGNFAPTTTLTRDADGKPTASGTYDVPFTAIVPACALEADHAKVGIIVYGHGLVGDSDQVNSGGARAAAAETCNVMVGTDMRGMSTSDVPNLLLALNDANRGYGVFDVLVQGMMNHIVLSQLATSKWATELFTTTGDSSGTSIVDPSKIYWYGISQGGIMGTTVCAIDPLLHRCVVQCGAINYSILLERSQDWPQYRTTLNGAYPNNFDTAMLISLMQTQWDRTEPSGWADMLADKQVFMQYGIADAEVSNLASEYQMRTMGIPLVTPAPHVPYGITGMATSTTSGAVMWDFDNGPIPSTNEAPPDNDNHGNIRNKKFTTDMIRHFYETGEIKNVCTAPTGCDCGVAGACGDAI
ncbi:MAG TPA: hypothetical protein VGM90_31360 [Kofleriaceae bacterium]|jgi:hypothetical protein